MKFKLRETGEDSLEERIDESNLPKTVIKLKTPAPLSLEEFIKRFGERYDAEESFRDSVNIYMGIKGLKKVRLAFGKKILPGWYKQKKEKLIKDYATRIKQDLDETAQLRADMEALRVEKEKTQSVEIEHRTALELGQAASEGYQQTFEEKTKAIRAVDEEHQQKTIDLENATQEAERRIRDETNTAIIVEQKLHQYVRSLPLFSVNESGELSFDEEKIVEKLQERFLDEIIAGIERDGGERGFYSSVKRKYTDVIAFWDDIEDLSELPEVEWTQSIIYSRSRGYKIPQYPYLVTGKKEEKGQNRTSLDTAIIIDSSGSMDGYKLELARKAGLANHALMRRLNPKNSTYLGYYSDEVHPVDSVGFIKGVRAGGWTRTDLALEWLYSSLEGKGFGIAYLITDGMPEGTDDILERCKKAASLFANNPYLMLRIFLVDPNDDVKKIIRGIGKAAGVDTKVIPVSGQDIGKGMIADISTTIGQMYAINDF